MLVLLLFAGLTVKAQQNSEIVGTVTDQTGAAVPGALLTLTQKETGFVYNAAANVTGGYEFAGLNVRTYYPKATAKGFETYPATGLTLNGSQTLATDVKSTVGAETVEVSVTANALQVQSESNEVSTLISGEQVTSIASAWTVTPTDKTQMFFREDFTQLPGSNNSTAAPEYDTGTTYLNQSYLYSLCHTFTPSLFLSVQASYTRSNRNNSCDLRLKCCR
jgi:hypothetical protein